MKKPSLRPATQDEFKTHSGKLKEFLQEKVQIEEGFKMGLISKSQMKKGLAENFNKKNNYMTENLLWNLAGTLFIWEIKDENKQL